MSITDDLVKLEQLLTILVTRYEQYFIGLEKREPLPLLSEVEKLVRRYSDSRINNTMYKHKYSTLVGRFNTYRERWKRIVRLIEEGKYSRDRFISDLHQRQHAGRAVGSTEHDDSTDWQDNELDRIYREFLAARLACNLPVDNISRELIAAHIDKKRPALAARLGTDDLSFRVVVEAGKPRIKVGQRK